MRLARLIHMVQIISTANIIMMLLDCVMITRTVKVMKVMEMDTPADTDKTRSSQ